MPTDTERRDVARRLRAYLETPAPWHLSDVVSDVLGDGGDYDKIQRLADLIEPAPSCKFWDVEGQECYSVRTVRPVDRDELLEIASEMRCIADEDAPFALRAFSRRIRKALGVES